MSFLVRAQPPSVTIWNRVEPRPRTGSFGGSLAANVRDPAWFLARQWQVGELTGEDAASPAFVTLGTTTTPLTKWTAGGVTRDLAANVPFERQALSEPFSPRDMSLQVEIGQVLEDLLAAALATASLSARFDTLRTALRAHFPFQAPTSEDPFNPLDTDTRRFLTICGGHAIDGAAAYTEAKTTADAAAVSSAITTNAQEKQAVFNAYKDLIDWVQRTWGDLGDTDPVAWAPKQLEYQVQVTAGSTGASTTMAVHPDPDGEVHWSSFDVVGTQGVTAGVADTQVVYPDHLRFRAMPAMRFWDFENNDVAIPDVKANTRDITKLLALDFMLVHGEDWYVLPFNQPVGSVARVDTLVVTDVFGNRTRVRRADAGAGAPSANRFSLFSCATLDGNGVPAGLSDLYISPPSAGEAMQIGPVLEDVRFARDEMANMAWGIERTTASAVGKGRPGRERDAAVDRTSPVTPPASQDKTSLLRYLVQTKVPINYVPLLAQPVTVGQAPIVLEKGANARPVTAANGTTTFTTVDAAGKILNPPGQNPYRINEEEVPRTGRTVQRAVYWTRWIDGTPHLWIARRLRAGAGEAQSGLRFDQALPTQNT